MWRGGLRAKHRANDVAVIQKYLVGMGYQLAYDWPSSNVDIRKPYREPANRKHNLAAQFKMLEAAAKADIFYLAR